MLRRLLAKLYRPRSRRRGGCHFTDRGAQVLEDRALLAVAFRFDYSLDTAGFFDAAERRDALELAGQIMSSRLGDTLSAITPGGGNTWTANFRHPATGEPVTKANLSIAQDEILVFAGARSLGATLGQGGWGGSSISGSSQWINTVLYRGQASNGTDFAPWGGTLTFSTTRTWHFGRTVEGLGPNEFDFVSLAVHELTHTLGFSKDNESYDRWISGSTFRGPRSIAEYDGSGNVPLDPGLSHWVSGTLDQGQAAVMAPEFSDGERQLPTPLDWAGLEDIGWVVDRSSRDYGDAPPGQYPTRSADDGAWHNIRSGLYLGTIADGETDGQVTDDADEFDDEDGVVLPTAISGGTNATVSVTANRSGRLNAWIDFNRDGDWTDSGEQIFDDVLLGAGTTQLAFSVPGTASPGDTWARFRLNSTGNLASTGGAADGEVEDHAVHIIGDIAAMDDEATVNQGGWVNVDVLANDLPPGRVRVIGFEQADQGVVTRRNNGELRFTAGQNDSGVATFQYTVGFRQQQLAGDVAGGELGRALAVYDDTLAAGAPLDPFAGPATGSVRVYQRGEFDWDLAQTIIAPDAQAGDRFGFSVAMEGNTLVIGARGDDDSATDAGAVYVYTRAVESAPFLFSQKLLASTPTPRDEFGFAVSVQGDTLVASARMDDEGGSNSGSIELFTRFSAASAFTFDQRVQPARVSKGDQFGASVVLHENRLYVGARKDNNNAKNNAGAVYVLEPEQGTWQTQRVVLPSRPENDGYFGHSIAVDGNKLVVGQPARQRPSRTGRVYVHARNKDGSDKWGLLKRIDGNSATGGNRFGFSVSITGNVLAVGAPRDSNGASVSGVTKVYERSEGGNNQWGVVRSITADNAGGGDEFGCVVLVSEDRLFAAARREDSGGTNSGSIYFDDLRIDIGEVTVTIIQ